MTTTSLALSDIKVPLDRMRQLRPEVVDELLESIGERGLLQPIIVRPCPRKGRGYLLVAGWHHREAARKLGWQTIPARVLDGLDVDAARLAEIDENLRRADLSPAERARHQAERKRLYEKLHPETRRGGDRRSAKAKSTRQNGDLKRYTNDAAKKTGRSERSVQREIERAAKIVVLDEIAGSSLDEGAELDALAMPSPK